jgi:signal transduction histidine kinase
MKDLPVGVIALDANHHIVYHNQAAPVHTDDQGNKSIELLFETSDPFERWLDEAENKSLMTQRAWTRISNALPDQPNRRVFDVIANYQKERSSGLDTVIICVDRSEHYAVDEEDMDFIALAAHELRGPITVIRGYLDVLAQETDLSTHPDHQVLLDRLDVSAARLSGYVGNILNVAKYDRRHLKLHLKEERLSNIYQTVADDLALRARAQGRSLSVNLPTDLPTIAADRNSLSEVMANLIDNAIKYSNEGGQVIVSASVDGDFVKFVVQDSGIGIPASVISNLFTKFYRSHRSATNVTGTGLGLYISKAIIESHGGKIGVKSVEGEGSVFSFSVPIYATVKDKLLGGNNESAITMSAHGWIKNHSMYES